MFKLDPQIKADTFHIADLSLSDLRLMNNKTLPWLMLVPKRVGCIELTDLTLEEQKGLIEEVNLVHQMLFDYQPDKINVGAIGNIVSQLHIHVVARFKEDPVWPAPVWGKVEANPYSDQECADEMVRLQALLKKHQ